MQKTIIAIGGGELKSKNTLPIDEYIANLGKKRAGQNRANALFIPTASHDFFPYFNSFKKVYTSVFDIKVDVALACGDLMDYDKIKQKFDKADIIYVGGGDTVFMLDKWKEKGLDKLLINAYNCGVVIAGVSAGGICWFENLFSDSAAKLTGEKYLTFKGLGLIKQNVCPHYNLRQKEFDLEVLDNLKTAYAIEDLAAAVFVDGQFTKSLSSGGAVYYLQSQNLVLNKTKI